jgi:hypothetical protein
MKKIYLFIACFLTIISGMSQQIETLKTCGTLNTTNYEDYSNNPNYISSNSTFATPPNYCINVFFRIVTKDDGSGITGFDPSILNQIINSINPYFASHQISFVNTGYDFINNSNLYDIDLLSTAVPNSLIKPNAINIFLVNKVRLGTAVWGGAAISGTILNFISINFNSTNQFQADLYSHELGHNLTLKHTFECFNVSYNYTTQQTECTVSPCAELPSGYQPIGYNCLERGDGICDTPADPRGCNQVNLSLYHPDYTNLMSYYVNRDHFTPGQGERMRDAILNEPFLQPARSNQCASITEPTNLCNDNQFLFSISGAVGNPIVYNWTAGTNLQIVGSTTNASVVVKVINPTISVSTILSVTINGVLKTKIFNTASLTTYNSTAAISPGAGNLCVEGDYRTFSITIPSNEIFQGWSISNTNIADLSASGNQATVTVLGNGGGSQTLTAKITNTCGQISSKNRTFYIGAPIFNKFTYGCANKSLCLAADANYAFTSPTMLNTKNRVIANFFGLTAAEAANSANWQWQEAPGNHLLYINNSSPKSYLDLCPIAAGTTTLQVRVKNSSCLNEYSDWIDLPITIIQLPSSAYNRPSQAPGTVSLKADPLNTLVTTNNAQYSWASDNIWVRNSQDGIMEHQNPVYNENVPNYVYVKVANTGCYSMPSMFLKTYWAKASTALNWPNTWNGATYNGSDTKLGDIIGTVAIPELQPEQETIISTPFIVPNPNKYKNIVDEPWRFGLLARVTTESDETTFTETEDLVQNLINNDNIALKNVTVVDCANNNPEEETIGGVIAVGNPFSTPKSFYLELVKEDLETGKPIYEEAEVSIKLDEELYQAWLAGGKQAERIDNTLNEKVMLVKDNNVFLKDIALDAYHTGNLYLKFNFLTKEITDKSRYVYHVIQRETGTNKIIGGETYVINKHQRPLFTAEAGGTKYVDKNEPITISAAQINESAIYNWYDSDGNLVATGKDLSISTEVARKFKLEIIATDGFKDYTEVEVKLKPNTLGIIAPNPAVDNINITYKLNDVSSAYLMILGSYGTANTSNNYILDVNSSDTNIDLSNYSNGFYTVALVCNGQIVDAKTVVKQ